MKRQKYIVFLLLLNAFAYLITGCGGGGGAPSQPPSQPPGPTPQAVQVNISGSATGLSSLVGASKAQTQTGAPLANATVEITVRDEANNNTINVTALTSQNGTFTAPIQGLKENSRGYMVITVKKPGFADWSKRIDFEKPSDINIQAELDAVITAIATRDNAVFSASSGQKVIKFGLFRNARGQKLLKTGRDVELTKQQGQNLDIEIAIPVNVIPSDVNSLVASLNSYDPTNKDEASRFPGQYRDSSGNPMVSLGFDFMDIRTDAGETLSAAIKKAVREGRLKKSQAEEYITITRWIYGDNCRSLLRDDNDIATQYGVDTTGFNVPVYAYSSVRGLWDLLGIGTVDVNRDGNIDSNNDVITTDLDGDGVAGGAGDYQKHCTDNGGEAILIKIKADDFQNNWNWCNLDYVVIERPVEICIEKTFKYSDGTPIEGLWVSLYDDVDYSNDSQWSFSYAWGSTDSSGYVKLTATLTSSTTDKDLTGKIGYYDPYTYEWKEEPVTLGESPNCTTKTNTITRPQLCQVEGYVKDETGAGVANQYIYIYSLGSYYWNYAYTENSGYFLMDAKCNEDQQVYAGWSWSAVATFNPDGTVSGYERSDDGTKVTLYDIRLENQAPYAYGWLSSSSIFAGQSITAYIYGWDNECDKPLSWKITGHPSGDITGTWTDCWGYTEQNITFNTAGTYNLTLYVTDSKGKIGSTSLGTVQVSQPATNRPPVITSAYPSKYVTGKAETITLYGNAYDPDGNSLSWNWYANESPIQNCSGTGTSVINTRCSYTTPDVEGQVTIRFEVSDLDTNGNTLSTASSSFDISVGVPGSIDIIIQKQRR